MTAKTMNMMMVLVQRFPTNDFDDDDDDDYENDDDIASGGATISHQDRSGF